MKTHRWKCTDPNGKAIPSVTSISYKEKNDMKPFNADEITLDNFEGIKKCKKRPIIVHCLQMNFPEGFEVTTKEGKLKGKQHTII